MQKLLKGALLVLITILLGALAYAAPPNRPNVGKELYTPPWDDEFVALAESCEDLSKAECELLRRLGRMPHAYWLGLNTDLNKELQNLHNVLRDAIRNKRVPTLVLYSLPHRDCGGGVRLGQTVTIEDYIRWISKLADAIGYYKNIPINIIIEPGGLAHLVTETDALCNRRGKSEILTERIELIRFAIWSFAPQDKKTKTRLNPNLRLFVDVGGPSRIHESKAKIDLANALEKILRGAEVDGVSVNITHHSSFNESVAWAKELIEVVRLKARKNLTIAIDTSRSGNKVVEGCNVPGAALGAQPPTLNHSDPQIELVLIIKDPSTSDGDGTNCNGGEPGGTFDLLVFRDYLRNTTLKR